MMKKLYFTDSHEYIELLGSNKARVGISNFAADQLGDAVYVELPEVEDEFDEDEAIATVESVKSVSEISLPFAVKIRAINEALEDEPELVNEDPQGKGWFFEVETEEAMDVSKLFEEDPEDDEL